MDWDKIVARDAERIQARRKDARYKSYKEQNNAARTERRRLNEKTFIGVDGEGVTRANGTHDYVLLSVGDQSYHLNDKPLDTLGIFEFLWDQYLENPEAVFAGFYLSYDFTMWFKGLPENRARMMLSKQGIAKRKRKLGKNTRPFPVEWEGWEFDMLGMKRFKLRRKGSESYMYVCDAGPFFQSSFLAAIDPSKWPEPICTPDEYEIIREGKTRRDVASFDKEMIRYNVLENEVLSRVLEKLNEGFVRMGVQLDRTRWYGPGQVAQGWLNNINAPDKDVATYEVPEPVREAAIASYYGGWFEIFVHGHIPGPSYEYDINSAYPFAISTLPCLSHGSWRHNDSPGFGSLTLCHVTVRGSNQKLGTMPCRTKKGAICRPQNVRGWYWLHEIEAAVRAGAIDSYTIHESWSYEQTCTHAPLSSVADLYLERLAVGKDTPYGKSLKLNYNSAYGKFAQSVGEPRYANPIYASLITSRCRTQVWDAISTHPDGVNALTMVATDAVFFRLPHPSLTISDNLGEWGYSEKSNLCQWMPGLYWDDKARSGAGIPKSRGINASDLAESLDRADHKMTRFKEVLEYLHDNPMDREMALFEREMVREMGGGIVLGSWPRISVPIRFNLVSAPLALHRNRWDTAGTIHTENTRLISSSPFDKRALGPVVHGDVIVSYPKMVGPDGLDTVPYDKSFGQALQLARQDTLTERGTFHEEFYEWLNNND